MKWIGIWMLAWVWSNYAVKDQKFSRPWKEMVACHIISAWIVGACWLIWG